MVWEYETNKMRRSAISNMLTNILKNEVSTYFTFFYCSSFKCIGTHWCSQVHGNSLRGQQLYKSPAQASQCNIHSRGRQRLNLGRPLDEWQLLHTSPLWQRNLLGALYDLECALFCAQCFLYAVAPVLQREVDREKRWRADLLGEFRLHSITQLEGTWVE